MGSYFDGVRGDTRGGAGADIRDDYIIELYNISKSFRSRSVLMGLDLKVRRGESLVIIGLGDSGKSVLLKIMLFLLSYDSGFIFLNGKSIEDVSDRELLEFRNSSGMLFQNNALFDSLSVRDNVGFYLDHHTGKSYTEVSDMVRDRLSRVGLGGMEFLKPPSLSGGMKKRVGIARAIIHKPSIMFFDDPTAGLDPIIADSIANLIKSIHRELGTTLVTVTNDIVTARKLGDRIAMLYAGKIYKIGDSEEILEGDDALIKQFINGEKEGPIGYYNSTTFL